VGKLGREGRIDVVKRAEKSLGITFRDPRLLQRALVHRSFLYENPQFAVGSNERLEFLGDAVVELIVSDYLYSHFPTAEEDRLTTMRAALVRAETLGRLARDLGLGRLLYLNEAADAAGARTRIRFLGQVFEAVVGAIYVDRGADAAREFVLRQLGPEIERVANEPALEDAKSRLQVTAHSATGLTPVYEVVSAVGPGHQPHYVVQVRLGDDVVGRGEGKKKKEAEQLAATEALGHFPQTTG
jgi:ribonuclease-3